MVVPNTWGANGNVLGLARAGNTLYIAGAFRSVGENSGGLMLVDTGTGQVVRPFPKVAGAVDVIVPDGLGGWYIGGDFTAVGGKSRSCLAQIRADGSVSDWDPSVTGSPGYVDPPEVTAIAVSGSRVFVGGGFREIGGQPHENLGCADAGTGTALGWNLDIDADGWIFALSVHDSTLFVGGTFTSIGGQARGYLAAVDVGTGAVLPWEADADYSVLTLLVRDDTLFAGGQFGSIAGGTRPYLAALDIRTAQLLSFDSQLQGIYVDYAATPRVDAMALAGDTLYAAGNFTQVRGQSRSSLVALNASTGAMLPWVPDTLGLRYAGFPPPLVESLAINGGTVYLGGWFSTVGGAGRAGVAAVDRESGRVLAWDPGVGTVVEALVVSDSTVYLAGDLRFVAGWRHRAGLAAIDLTTGTVRPWNPNPDGRIVSAIAVDAGRVFVSGDFTIIGGDPQPRSYLAALDTLNGEVLDWNPSANSVASAFLLRGDTLYAGGEFTSVGGQVRNYLASIDATSGEVTSWDPNASNLVQALAQDGNTIYAGGVFDRIGNSPRRGLAALDAITGELTDWNPAPNIPLVESLLLRGGVLYAGGAFASIGGQPRSGLASLDLVTGSATSWNPTPGNWDIVSARIRALAGVDSLLYVGGDFGTIGGESRTCLAAVDTVTGRATSWDPGLNGYVWSLAAADNSLCVGGGFTRAGGSPCSALAVFMLPAAPAGPTTSTLVLSIMPNPCQGGAVARFSLPTSAAVKLDVYDLQGRRVTSVLHEAVCPAGVHDVPISTAGWSEGVHFLRLQAGGAEVTKKLVIVR